MPDIVKIIVVEDDLDQFQTYLDAAEDHSVDGIRIELVKKVNAEDALSELLSKDFDGAIIDLNLSRSDPNEASGNKVIQEIINKHRFPVFIVSGNLENLNSCFLEKESSFLKFFNRDEDNNVIFTEMLDVYKTGITKILGGRGKIEASLNDIFWTHLANNFPNWLMNERNNERWLLRYTVSHLAEYLDLPDGEDKFYHEAECYITPPIKQYAATGDILEIEGKRFINLTPACDLAIREVIDGTPSVNADMVILAPLIKVNRNDFVERNLISVNDNKRSIERKLEDMIKGKRERFSFLPAYGAIYASVVDFQNVHSYPFEYIVSANRLATVSGVFLKDIQSRFSSYYGRQGQPDLDKKELLRNYNSLLLPNG